MLYLQELSVQCQRRSWPYTPPGYTLLLLIKTTICASSAYLDVICHSPTLAINNVHGQLRTDRCCPIYPNRHHIQIKKHLTAGQRLAEWAATAQATSIDII